MEKIELRMNEQLKYDVIKSCDEGKVTKQFCEEKLNVSRRTVDRLLKKYRTHGKAAFIHGNRGRIPVTKKSDRWRNDIPLLYQNKYAGTDFSQFTKLLAENEAIYVSESYVRLLMKQEHLLSPKPWHKTKKAEAARLKSLRSNKT